MPGRSGGFFAVVGVRSQAAAFAGGGQRRFGMPNVGDDPTDTFDARAALLPARPLTELDHVGIAVVDKALRDFRMYARTRHPLRREWFEGARAFLFDQDVDVGWPLTFSAICERLEIDLDTARLAIQHRRGSVRRVRFRAHQPAQPTIHIEPVRAARLRRVPVVRPRHVWLAVPIQLELDLELQPHRRPLRLLARPVVRLRHGRCRHCLCAAISGDLFAPRSRHRPRHAA